MAAGCCDNGQVLCHEFPLRCVDREKVCDTTFDCITGEDEHFNTCDNSTSSKRSYFISLMVSIRLSVSVYLYIRKCQLSKTPQNLKVEYRGKHCLPCRTLMKKKKNVKREKFLVLSLHSSECTCVSSTTERHEYEYAYHN